MESVVLMAVHVPLLRGMMSKHLELVGQPWRLDELLDVLFWDMLTRHTYLFGAVEDGALVGYLWAGETEEGMEIIQIHTARPGAAYVMYTVLRRLALELGIDRIYGTTVIDPNVLVNALGDEHTKQFAHIEGQRLWDDLRPDLGHKED